MVIKITEEMYDDAVNKAMMRFNESGGAPTTASEIKVSIAMSLQNALFATMLRTELFNIKEDK